MPLSQGAWSQEFKGILEGNKKYLQSLSALSFPFCNTSKVTVLNQILWGTFSVGENFEQMNSV